VVLCNLSSSPVKLALSSAIKGLNLRGHYLHTLLRSDNAMGAQDIDAVALSPFSVYIGELRR
jgi:alpha-glucosidase